MSSAGRWIAGALLAEVATVGLLAAGSVGQCSDPSATAMTCTGRTDPVGAFEGAGILLGLAILTYCIVRAVRAVRSTRDEDPPTS